MRGCPGHQHQGVHARDHPWYQDAVDFCHRWDQCAFDPDYESLPLEFFEPMVRRVFGREPFGLAPRG